MDLRRLSSVAAVAASAAVFQISHVPLRGQDDPPAAKAKGKAKRITGAAPRLADGKPDLSGVWGSDRPFVVDIRGAVTKGENSSHKRLGPGRHEKPANRRMIPRRCVCRPGDRDWRPYPMKFLQMPNLFVILFEGNIHTYRQIYLDRREHPKDLNPN